MLALALALPLPLPLALALALLLDSGPPGASRKCMPPFIAFYTDTVYYTYNK